MQKEQFINLVSERLKDVTGCEVIVNPVNKNNGVVLTGLSIMRGGRNIQPTIYLESYYEDYQAGRSIESIIESILELENEHPIDVDFNVDYFLDFNWVSHDIFDRSVKMFGTDIDFVHQAAFCSPYTACCEVSIGSWAAHNTYDNGW